MTKPMSPEERVEAAMQTYMNCLGIHDRSNEGSNLLREDAGRILAAAYPELASGTHVLVPREPTEEMIGAGADNVGSYTFAEGAGQAADAYRAMLAAYESSTKTD